MAEEFMAAPEQLRAVTEHVGEARLRTDEVRSGLQARVDEHVGACASVEGDCNDFWSQYQNVVASIREMGEFLDGLGTGLGRTADVSQATDQG